MLLNAEPSLQPPKPDLKKFCFHCIYHTMIQLVQLEVVTVQKLKEELNFLIANNTTRSSERFMFKIGFHV